MSRLPSVKETDIEKYGAVLSTVRITYNKSLYEAESATSKSLPIEQVEFRNLRPFSYRRYRTMKDVELMVRITDRNVIIRCLPLHIFTYADTYYGAIENLKTLLIDYYNDLRKDRKNLAKNLLQDLEYLENLIVAK